MSGRVFFYRRKERRALASATTKRTRSVGVVVGAAITSKRKPVLDADIRQSAYANVRRVIIYLWTNLP